MSESKQPMGDEHFEQRARALLQESADQLDGATRSRLTQARHAALDAIKQRQTNVGTWLMPAAGLAAAAVVAVMLSVNPDQQDAQQLAAAVVDELEIVTAEDSLEFYRDVEFYSWLDTVLDEETAAPESEV